MDAKLRSNVKHIFAAPGLLKPVVVTHAHSTNGELLGMTYLSRKKIMNIYFMVSTYFSAQ